MLNIKRNLSIVLVIGQTFLFPVAAFATPSTSNTGKEAIQADLKACMKDLDYNLEQKLELIKLKKQTDLSKGEKLEAYMAILTDSQRQSFKNCAKEAIQADKASF